MASEWGVPFIECSAKNNTNIEDIFQRLIAHTEARQVCTHSWSLMTATPFNPKILQIPNLISQLVQ